MSFRFQKRIKISKGLGVNISKSGISPSYRTKKGSVSSKGFSVRTGIAGLSFRKSLSKTSKKGCLGILLIIITLTISLFLTIKNI